MPRVKHPAQVQGSSSLWGGRGKKLGEGCQVARKLEKSHSASLGVMGTTQPEAAMREPASRHRIGRRGEGLVSSVGRMWNRRAAQCCWWKWKSVELPRRAVGPLAVRWNCISAFTSGLPPERSGTRAQGALQSAVPGAFCKWRETQPKYPWVEEWRMKSKWLLMEC